MELATDHELNGIYNLETGESYDLNTMYILRDTGRVLKSTIPLLSTVRYNESTNNS